jgi:putative endonuclease
MQAMFTVYILYSKNFQKTYVGQTKDLANRLLEHNETAVKGFTVSYRPWVLIYHEDYATRSEAMRREKYLKSGMGREFVKTIALAFIKNQGAMD